MLFENFERKASYMRIISLEQRGFVCDRNISGCVILASEMINLLTKKQFGGNIAIKVDIRKAFDTLDWNFLIAVLTRFRFSNLFCDWILVILRYAHLSVLVNGKAIGYYVCARGCWNKMCLTINPKEF